MKFELGNTDRFIVSQIGGDECHLGTDDIKLGTEGSSASELENPPAASSPNTLHLAYHIIMVHMPAHAQQELVIRNVPMGSDLLTAASLIARVSTRSRRTEPQQPVENGTQNAVISKLLPLTNTRPPLKSLADVGGSPTGSRVRKKSLLLDRYGQGHEHNFCEMVCCCGNCTKHKSRQKIE
jgi:hypothetical protein